MAISVKTVNPVNPVKAVNPVKESFSPCPGVEAKLG
jgi:hypothetical protein